ncbi:hypothetical protein SAMN02910291_00268 [Desulfovibrio desulfuricans]|uniref:Uncharacterized protein n=1 Tax=Desulfovibrio desulfuricans TaxID=876 RepID=A0AA94HQF6_DESDE|nr:hypothetical protein SAMN02910291_00268 [Desulfovibrio desulfuricans]SPD34414.1 Hypothetical protein DSVG11_0288 [Desulfovibrio sp. G11]
MSVILYAPVCALPWSISILKICMLNADDTPATALDRANTLRCTFTPGLPRSR